MRGDLSVAEPEGQQADRLALAWGEGRRRRLVGGGDRLVREVGPEQRAPAGHLLDRDVAAGAGYQLLPGRHRGPERVLRRPTAGLVVQEQSHATGLVDDGDPKPGAGPADRRPVGEGHEVDRDPGQGGRERPRRTRLGHDRPPRRGDIVGSVVPA